MKKTLKISVPLQVACEVDLVDGAIEIGDVQLGAYDVNEVRGAIMDHIDSTQGVKGEAVGPLSTLSVSSIWWRELLTEKGMTCHIKADEADSYLCGAESQENDTWSSNPYGMALLFSAQINEALGTSEGACEKCLEVLRGLYRRHTHGITPSEDPQDGPEFD
jgi:hypothetical protein